ncbi:MAG: threonylcarbamoyl-AMP synthase [Lachnospiraceae bacterium]|nr:threonylcarbamoyl-AMP synthase [Lachnospiraceae bacterium]
MITEKVKISNPDNLTEADGEILKKAGEIIKNGGVVAFPTETVYGLGGNALDAGASKKIYAAKGRPSDNPLIVHISDFGDIYEIAEAVPEYAKRLAEIFWPGPLTMILKKKAKVPDETTGGLDTVAVRMPDSIIARNLIKYAGGYIAAPSANISGKPSPTEARFVTEDMDGRIDMIIDGGAGEVGIESTIIDLTVSPPEILRPGFITREMIEGALKTETRLPGAEADPGTGPRAPGMKYRHYAPRAPLYVVEAADKDTPGLIARLVQKEHEKGRRAGVLATEGNAGGYIAEKVENLGRADDGRAIARNLFRALREMDDADVDVIYAESLENKGVGTAVMNRLLKAAGNQIIT